MCLLTAAQMPTLDEQYYTDYFKKYDIVDGKHHKEPHTRHSHNDDDSYDVSDGHHNHRGHHPIREETVGVEEKEVPRQRSSTDVPRQRSSTEGPRGAAAPPVDPPTLLPYPGNPAKIDCE